MCGIAGFVSDNPDYDQKAIVSKMLSAMKHRGPNQSGLAKHGPCTIGMVRLSIIDTTDHDIPIYSLDRNHATVYNGEIYNAKEIKESKLTDCEFRTVSDGEVALNAFVKMGIPSLNEFNGMYAFAVYDIREEELVIIRDKVGEKPLYYCQGHDYFIFASEMKALLTFVEPHFNNKAYSYWSFEFTFGEETLYKGIKSVLPGEYLTIDKDGVRIRSYWKIWENRIDVPDDPKKVKEEITEIIYDAARLRMRNSSHQSGVLVSGGLDSALIASIAKPDYLFTCHYPLGEDFDELNYAQILAKQLKKELIIIEPSKEDFLRTESDILYHLDSPCTWTSFSWWMLMEEASKHLKVILTGDGADEMFGGYHRYLLLYNDEQIHNMPSMRQYAYLKEKYYGSSVDRYIRLINRCDNQFDNEVLEFLEREVSFYFSKYENDVINSMGLSDFYTTMQVLLQMSDRISMAFGIENRSPFLDYRLVQYCFSLPSHFKVNNGVTKCILKEISRDFVSDEIVNRIDKRGFSAPINKWFNNENCGKYDRSFYRNRTFNKWMDIFIRREVCCK